MAIKIRIVSDFDAKGITKANQALNDMGKAAGVALAAVGVAMVGIAAKSVQEFGKFDAALVKSKAIMGDLTETMEKDMSNAAREVAKVTTFSAEQAAESYFFLASAGLDAESSIAALPQVAQFAQAGMFDMALATDLLTDAQSALGLTIRNDAVKNMENMVKVSDVLVRANTLANASVEQFSVALTTKAGAALRALGKDVEEGVAVLAAFADQGIKGEIAGTQLSIVLRDLTTKAINNKDAFDKMGIAVFDSNGEMNNLGDIIGNLETALAGMSDETQKATLLQLGFSDKSLASLQALLGTSEAIKTYERELRSASGFTGDVATKQLDSFESQMKLLESAVIDVAIEIGQELTPYLQDLIPVIQKLLPEIGAKLSAAVKQVDWAGIAEDVANFFVAFVENIDTIIEVTRLLGLFAIGLVTYTTATRIANTATAIFNSTLRLNPFVLLATGIVTATIALQGFHNEQKRNREAATGLTGRTAEINAEFARLKELLDNNIITFSQYRSEIDPLVVELSRLEGQFGATAGEANRFNNLNLANARAEMAATADLGARLANNQRQLYFAMRGETAPEMGTAFGLGAAITNATTTTTNSGPSAFEQARKKVQDLISSGQKQLNDAQKTFARAQASARQNYADNILQIEKDFASRLSGIIQQSQDRLRTAYRSAVETNLVALFDQQETKSVEGLVQSLADRLAGSRKLLQNSALLASQGFSQTFIEQVVSAGTETGNQLASAILQSTPETQSELQSLFSAIEAEASSGMDSLANEIYRDQGLATDELKNLYRSTQQELSAAMLEQQNILRNALIDANDTLIESIQTIKSALNQQLADMNGQFGGMGSAIRTFTSELDTLIAKYQELARITKDGVPTGGANLDALVSEQQRILDRIAENQAVLTGGTAGPGARDWAQKKLDSYQEQLAAITSQLQAAEAIATLTPSTAMMTAQSAPSITNQYTVNVSSDNRSGGVAAGEAIITALKTYGLANGPVTSYLGTSQVNV